MKNDIIYSMFSIVTTDSLLNRLILSSGILLVTFIISFLMKKSIDLIFFRLRKFGFRTVRSLLKNIIDVIIFLISFLTIISQWGINIGPILTGAGIIGLAFSFGAQTLVKDLIAGFFIITEGQFKIGDRIKVGNYEGEVHKMTLRLTVLKDVDGNLIYIPNSQITTVVKLK